MCLFHCTKHYIQFLSAGASKFMITGDLFVLKNLVLFELMKHILNILSLQKFSLCFLQGKIFQSRLSTDNIYVSKLQVPQKFLRVRSFSPSHTAAYTVGECCTGAPLAPSGSSSRSSRPGRAGPVIRNSRQEIARPSMCV